MADFLPLSILLAEDNRVHQHLLLLAIAKGRPHVNVTVVDTGAEFLRALKLRQFDCTVLDYNLPDYRADELLQAARRDLSHCPTIIISGSDDQNVVIDSMRQGGADFVPKDRALAEDELWNRIEHVVKARREERRERRKSERRERYLAKLAETDQLTGLSNRRYLDRCVDEKRWENERRRHLSLVLLDIDHFKDVNDTFGHGVGDEVLKKVAKLVKAETTGNDVAVRWGGEEMLVLRHTSDVAEAWAWAEQLRRSLEATTIEADDVKVNVTASFGVHLCESAAFCLEAVDEVDAALYLAKDRGRNQVCTDAMVKVDQAVEAAAARADLSVEQRRLELLTLLRPALDLTQWEHVTGHCERVAEAAAMIGRQLGLDQVACERLRLAGLFHDLGKIEIPEALLAKPGPLTPLQRTLMAQHVRAGSRISARLGADQSIVAYLEGHHQRYSDDQADAMTTEGVTTVGVTTEGVTSADHGAAVLNVADAFVTMRSNRPYRPARSTSAALSELRSQSGRQFDPVSVDAVHCFEAPAVRQAA